MDMIQFTRERNRILENHEGSPQLLKIRQKVDLIKSRPQHGQQIPFSFGDQPACCAEWGWPDDEEHHELVIKVIQHYFQKYLGWKWRIRNVMDANMFEHHGIGQRIDDLKTSKQYSGILVKQYEQVFKSNDKNAKKEMAQAKRDFKGKGKPLSSPPPRSSPPKQQPSSPRNKSGGGLTKSKSWKKVFGKKKKRDSDEDSSGEAPRRRKENDDDGYFY